MIYFDNNATTIMPAEVVKSMCDWCNKGNPSASYRSARDAQKMMGSMRQYIRTTYNIGADYRIIFTSGASESNCTILRGAVDSYNELVGRPHIVMSAVEHKSLIMAAESLQIHGRATYTLVRPTASGHIRVEDVMGAITPATCIICVMHANNETGAINDIRAIGAAAHRANIPFHCDTVQTAGRLSIDPARDHIDSFCISFHKLHGPPGIGALVVRDAFITGYRIAPLIFGTQNDELRGGTENLPGIGAAFTAMMYTMKDRSAKNKKMSVLKSYICDEIAARAPSRSYIDYLRQRGPRRELEIVFLSGVEKYLPNTIFLSVVKYVDPPICNVKIKTDLERSNIIISVGSACNTANKMASHVLYAMNADERIRKGALRISLGDHNTMEECEQFVREFLKIIKTYL